MKKLILAFAALFASFAFSTNASAASYVSETLEETFTNENIDYDFTKSNYSDSGDKVTIYVFRNAGCSNCKNFYNFVKSQLLENYADQFKVVSYELSQNRVNFTLLEQLASFFNQTSSNSRYGAPIVIVGSTMSQDFVTSSREQEIINLINSHTTYDVMQELNDGVTNINDSLKTQFTASNNATLKTSDPFYRSHTFNSTAIDASSVKLDDYEYISAYDLTFANGTTPVALTNTNLTISLPVNKTYKSYKVVYLNRGSIAETYDATYQNNQVTFNTSHLSEYAIFGTNTTSSPAPVVPIDPTTPAQNNSTTSNQKTTKTRIIPTAPNTSAGSTASSHTQRTNPSYLELLTIALILSGIGFMAYRKHHT